MPFFARRLVLSGGQAGARVPNFDLEFQARSRFQRAMHDPSHPMVRSFFLHHCCVACRNGGSAIMGKFGG